MVVTIDYRSPPSHLCVSPESKKKRFDSIRRAEKIRPWDTLKEALLATLRDRLVMWRNNPLAERLSLFVVCKQLFIGTVAAVGALAIASIPHSRGLLRHQRYKNLPKMPPATQAEVDATEMPPVTQAEVDATGKYRSKVRQQVEASRQRQGVWRKPSLDVAKSCWNHTHAEHSLFMKCLAYPDDAEEHFNEIRLAMPEDAQHEAHRQSCPNDCEACYIPASHT